jgi:peptidyl-prolyl cis-trans isomerase SurA
MNPRLSRRVARPVLVALSLALAAGAAVAQLRAPGQGGSPSLRLPGTPPAPPQAPAGSPEQPATPMAPGSVGAQPAPAGPGLRVPAPPGAAQPAPLDASPRSSRPIQEVDRVVAVVNKDVITLRELERRVEMVSRQLSRQGAELPPRNVLLRQLLERMIVDRAQLQLAREYGLRVDDQTLDRAVAGIAQENGLSLAQLRQRVEGEGQSFSRFREDIRGEILRARLREREVDSKVQVSEADIDAFLAAQGAQPESATEYRVAQILLRVPEGATPEQIEGQRKRGEELRKQLENGASFARLAAAFSDAPEALNGGLLDWRPADRLPELFAKTVAPMKVGEVSALLRSAAGFHLLQLADKRDGGAGKSVQTAPVTQTRARHILIRPNELVSEDEAIRRLREIRQRVEGGTAEFAEMARQYSSDGSAGRGGDLGWIYPGDTVPEFERAMGALAPGQLSEPVRTPFGVHLIQVIDRRTDEASPERVRQRAREVLRARRIEERYEDWLRQLRDSTYVEYKLEGN